MQFIQYSWVNDNSVKKYKRNKINRYILSVPEGDVMNNVAYHQIMQNELISKNDQNFRFFQVFVNFRNFLNLDSMLSKMSKIPIEDPKLSTFYEIVMQFLFEK